MKSLVTRGDIVESLKSLGLGQGDVVLARAALGKIGRIQGGARSVLDALLDVIGEEGTLISLAFTETSFIRKPDRTKPFTVEAPTYAGALPKAMLEHPSKRRSRHPTCSFVAIGKHADAIVEDHDARSGAYEPVRKLMGLGGKGLLIGCVESSPGFTTAHLAEADLGLHRRVVLPWLNSVYYLDENEQLQLFVRRDHGLCSQGFTRFYEFYVKKGILRSGNVGAAYSIVVPLEAAYSIERSLLSTNPRFAICDNPSCVMCNVRRWDRIHRVPAWFSRRFLSRLRQTSRE